MILTPKQIEEMTEAAKPLIKWMNENAHPHCEVIIDQTSVTLLEGIAMVPVNEFVKG